MTSGPLADAVKAGAVALRLGMDPAMLAQVQDPELGQYLDRVLVEAQRLHVEEVRALVEAVGASVGDRVARVLTQALPH